MSTKPMQTIDALLDQLPEPEREFCLKCRVTSKQKYPASYPDSRKVRTIADAIVCGLYWGYGDHAKRLRSIHDRALSGEFNTASQAKTTKLSKTVNVRDIHPTTLKALNMRSDARYSILSDRMTDMEARIMERIDATAARLVKDIQNVEASVAVIRSGASFMQQLEKDARQLQDMKEVGEKWDTPKAEPPVVEKWVPKVGDWVCYTKDSVSSHGEMNPGIVDDRDIPGSVAVTWACNGAYGPYRSGENVADLRPATTAEVQAHKAAIEAAKVPKFGDRVEYGGLECDVVSRQADQENEWTLLHANKPGGTGMYWAKRHEFKIIE